MTASTAEAVVTYWDDRAHRGYDQQPGQDPARSLWHERITPLVRDAVGEGARILDSGCGTGFLARILAAAGHRVTGQDLSPGMLGVAAERGADERLDVTWRVGSSDSPPEGQFDAVVTRNVLWTLPEPERTVRKWAEVLRPGGLLLISDGLWGQAEVADSDVAERFTASYAEQRGQLPLSPGLDFATCAELVRAAGFGGATERTALFDSAPYPSAPGFFLLEARKPR